LTARFNRTLGWKGTLALASRSHLAKDFAGCTPAAESERTARSCLESVLMSRSSRWGLANGQVAPNASRERILHELDQPGTLAYNGHFADVVFGEVRHTTDGRSWIPVE
jgi:hypothetical protein